MMKRQEQKKSWKNQSESYREKSRETATNSAQSTMVGVSNHQFAKDNGKFRAACEAAGVEPTPRQASKWRRGMGSARKGGSSC